MSREGPVNDRESERPITRMMSSKLPSSKPRNPLWLPSAQSTEAKVPGLKSQNWQDVPLLLSPVLFSKCP